MTVGEGKVSGGGEYAAGRFPSVHAIYKDVDVVKQHCVPRFDV